MAGRVGWLSSRKPITGSAPARPPTCFIGAQPILRSRCGDDRPADDMASPLLVLICERKWGGLRGFREISTMHFHRGGFHRGGWIAVLLAIVMMFAAAPLRAAGLEEALAHFTSDDYGEIEEGIAAVAASGDARAAALIEALQDGRLLYSAERKKVFYKDASGKLFDAVTNAAIADSGPADIDAVGVNNRIRRAIDAALGGLTLMSPRPGQAPRVRPGGVQIARGERLAGGRGRASRRKPIPASSACSTRRAPPSSSIPTMPPKPTRSPPSR